MILFSQNLELAQNSVKKKFSKCGICYTLVSKSYKKSKDFTSYKTMEKYMASSEKIKKTAAKKNCLIKI